MSFLLRGQVIGLIVVAIVQLAVPINMIRAREASLTRGVAYKFETAPVDPVDVFRGRYVALNFSERFAPVPDELEIKRGQWVYVGVETGADGFAKLSDASQHPPESGDYIKVRSRSDVKKGAGNRTVNLRLPFDRFYMDEDKAPAAERAVWQRRALTEEERQPSYALVRVLRGRSALEDVIVGGVPIAEAAEAVLQQTADEDAE